ncbi:MAG: glycosyltransferase family 2 protein [Planctomycetes bacterium]|nr:glycosyltransferase family 2 protein [Planctomycetota bacterium]
MIDVMMITHNEALNLPRSLRALQGWTNRIFVIDSGSTDGTPDLARSFGAEVIHHDWEGYARQKNWGLDNLPFESPWVLILDADEVVTTGLRDRLVEIASRKLDTVTENGFFINRLTYFLNRPIRHCGFFPIWNMRFFKRGAGTYEDREVHEHVVIDAPLGYVKEPMIHDDQRGLEHYYAKHNRYSTLEARSIYNEMSKGTSDRGGANLTGEARRRRWLKRNVMPHVPLPALWRFLYMYVIRLGVLDGWIGLEFCRFIASYDALVALKLRELRRLAKTRGSGAAVVHDPPVTALAVPEGGERVLPASTPAADPDPTGCGWGRAFELPAFYAADGVLAVAGLAGHPNEITVYPCGDGFVCADLNGATLSANPASSDFHASMAGVTVDATKSVLTGGGCCDDDEPGSPPGVQAAGDWVFHPGQIWVGHGSDVAPATADKVQEMIRAAASRFLERLSIGIRDPAFSLRLTESEGTPVHLAESEESVPVSPNLERLYPYTTKTLGEKLCRTTNWVAMAVKVLRLKESKEFAYGVSSPTGRIIQWRYSEPACGRLCEKLERYPEWDPYHVW